VGIRIAKRDPQAGAAVNAIARLDSQFPLIGFDDVSIHSKTQNKEYQMPKMSLNSQKIKKAAATAFFHFLHNHSRLLFRGRLFVARR
jgi:hypothetical protein